MSVTVNLLPDIRQARIRDKRLRRTVTSLAILVWSVSGAIVLLLFLFSVGQKVTNDGLTKKIADKETQLTATSGLLEALTAQQHLGDLSAANQQRSYFTKFFTTYEKSNPNDIALRDLSFSNTDVLNVSGLTKSYQNVTKLAKAMDASGSFKDVSILSASLSENGVNFTLTANVPTEVISGN